jgi:hypothetical protein
VRKPSRKTPLVSLLTLTASIVVAGGVTASPASADPGFCGVRVSMQEGGGHQEIYTVRNQCSTGYNFAVFLPSLGRRADPGCKYIGPTGTTGFWSVQVDPNWYVQVC